MQMTRNYEDLLPVDKSMNYAAELLLSHYDDYLAVIKDTYGSVIDLNTEILLFPVDIKKMSGVLSHLFLDTDPDKEAQSTVYRSICFAMQTAWQFSDGNYGWNLEKYAHTFSPQNSDEVVSEIIRTQTTHYYEQRPALSKLVDKYVPDLSPDGRYVSLAEMVVGLFFMVGERSLGEKYFSDIMDL